MHCIVNRLYTIVSNFVCLELVSVYFQDKSVSSKQVF